MFTTVHEEVSDDKYNAPTIAEPVPAPVLPTMRKSNKRQRNQSSLPQLVITKKEAETPPQQRTPSQPIPLYLLNQEVRDSSMIFTIQVLHPGGEANMPFIELFLPLDPDVSPEITLHTAVLRQIGRGKHTTLILER